MAVKEATRAQRASTQKIAPALAIPALKKGEVYVGATIGPDGKGAHCILLPGDFSGLTFAAALAKAKELGGDLPTRPEQALLYAHHKGEFKPDIYWSNTQHADDSSYAWYQDFGWGDQLYWGKSNKLRARAVRRVPI